jgi:predicted P-loop ATPase/GTPase
MEVRERKIVQKHCRAGVKISLKNKELASERNILLKPEGKLVNWLEDTIFSSRNIIEEVLKKANSVMLEQNFTGL